MAHFVVNIPFDIFVPFAFFAATFPIRLLFCLIRDRQNDARVGCEL
jgi:hypothetical protein